MCTCCSSRCTPQQVSQPLMMKETCLNFLITSFAAKESHWGIRMCLHRKKLFYDIGQLFVHGNYLAAIRPDMLKVKFLNWPYKKKPWTGPYYPHQFGPFFGCNTMEFDSQFLGTLWTCLSCFKHAREIGWRTTQVDLLYWLGCMEKMIALGGTVGVCLCLSYIFCPFEPRQDHIKTPM